MISLFYKWGNLGMEKLFPKVTQLVSGGIGI